MQVELFSFGGAEEVTGSKHFLQVANQQHQPFSPMLILIIADCCLYCLKKTLTEVFIQPLPPEIWPVLS